MLVSNHIKIAFFSGKSLNICANDKEMKKEYTRMITSPEYSKKTPYPTSWMFFNYY
jgi:hypothetical protein